MSPACPLLHWGPHRHPVCVGCRCRSPARQRRGPVGAAAPGPRCRANGAAGSRCRPRGVAGSARLTPLMGLAPPPAAPARTGTAARTTGPARPGAGAERRYGGAGSARAAARRLRGGGCPGNPHAPEGQTQRDAAARRGPGPLPAPGKNAGMGRARVPAPAVPDGARAGLRRSCPGLRPVPLLPLCHRVRGATRTQPVCAAAPGNPPPQPSLTVPSLSRSPGQHGPAGAAVSSTRCPRAGVQDLLQPLRCPCPQTQAAPLRPPPLCQVPVQDGGTGGCITPPAPLPLLPPAQPGAWWGRAAAAG